MDDYKIGTWFYNGPTTWMIQYVSDDGPTYTFNQGVPDLIIGPTIEFRKKSFSPKSLVLYVGQEHILYGK